MSSWSRRPNVATSSDGRSQLLVFLLSDIPGAIIHGDADPALIGVVGTAAMPEAPHPHQHTALALISAAMVS